MSCGEDGQGDGEHGEGDKEDSRVVEKMARGGEHGKGGAPGDRMGWERSGLR